MNWLASKKVSGFCFLLNCLFCGAALMNGDFFWFIFSFIFAILCFHNYKTTG